MVKNRQILVAFPAEEFDLAQDLRVDEFGGEAAVGILDVVCGDNNVVGYFEEINTVAANRANQAIDNR